MGLSSKNSVSDSGKRRRRGMGMGGEKNDPVSLCSNPELFCYDAFPEIFCFFPIASLTLPSCK